MLGFTGGSGTWAEAQRQGGCFAAGRGLGLPATRTGAASSRRRARRTHPHRRHLLRPALDDHLVARVGGGGGRGRAPVAPGRLGPAANRQAVHTEARASVASQRRCFSGWAGCVPAWRRDEASPRGGPRRVSKGAMDAEATTTAASVRRTVRLSTTRSVLRPAWCVACVRARALRNERRLTRWHTCSRLFPWTMAHTTTGTGTYLRRRPSSWPRCKRRSSLTVATFPPSHGRPPGPGLRRSWTLNKAQTRCVSAGLPLVAGCPSAAPDWHWASDAHCTQVLERLQTAVDAPAFLDKLATPVVDASMPSDGAHVQSARATRVNSHAADRFLTRRWPAVRGRHTAQVVVLAPRAQRQRGGGGSPAGEPAAGEQCG